MTGRRFRRTMEMIPALRWQSRSPSVSTPMKQSTKQGTARGGSEVRRGTSSTHFRCPAPGRPISLDMEVSVSQKTEHDKSWKKITQNNQKTREGRGCPKFLAGEVFGQISTLLENSSPIFRQHEMLSLRRFGHFPARKTAAGKLVVASGTLLDFLLRDRHSLLEFF